MMFNTAYSFLSRMFSDFRTNFTQGGVCAFKSDKYGDKDKMAMMERCIINDREGFYGWFGLGGSILQVI